MPTIFCSIRAWWTASATSALRHPERPDRFLLARSMAPALVTEKDVLDFDLDGEPLDAARAARPYLERFIHSEIYRPGRR